MLCDNKSTFGYIHVLSSPILPIFKDFFYNLKMNNSLIFSNEPEESWQKITVFYPGSYLGFMRRLSYLGVV